MIQQKQGTLRGQVAIVTGGSSGIGKATAQALSHAGAKVVIVGRDLDRIRAAREEILLEESLQSEDLEGWAFDVRKPEDMMEMAERAVQHFGTVDILIAAAGSGGSRATQRGIPYALVQLPEEEWDEIIDTNLKGIFLSNRAVLAIMIQRRRGEIINISSSRGAYLGLPYAAAYSASKHGVMGLSEALAEEVRTWGIRVQVLLPDVTDTPMLHVTGDLAPHGLLRTSQVASLVLQMLQVPQDTILSHALLAPFPSEESGMNKID